VFLENPKVINSRVFSNTREIQTQTNLQKERLACKDIIFIIIFTPVSVLSKLGLITEGWANLIWPSHEVEAIAKKRAEICAENKCGHLSFMMEKDKSGAYCDHCMCPLASKLRARGERCPKGLWEQELKKS
jgi:hypothetical protein